VCRTCRIALHDGVEYQWCPRCNGEVDWVDHRYHVWSCEPCDLVVNKRARVDACPHCSGPLAHLSAPVEPAEVSTRGRGSMSTAMRNVGIALIVLQAVFAVLDPDGFPYLAPVLLFAQLAGLVTVAVVLSASRELRALATDRATRIVHGIEHATMNVLEERGVPCFAGQTTTGMFVIEIRHDGRHYETLETTVRDAATDAISRIRFGDRKLAYDTRCGTSLLVAYALLAFAIVAAGIAALAAGMAAGHAYVITVAAAALGWLARQRAGLAAQRWLTVSTDFSSALVTRVDKRISADGDTLTAIVMIDVIPRAVDEVDAVAPVPM
jgi:hypothetical protein